jgi:2-C-methyl-D-erythritol 4-phosphate cytidylyltransferase
VAADAFDPDDLIDDVCVVLLAGGSGERLGSTRPKAFVGLGGKVLLAHSLEVFEAHEAVDSIVLVVPPEWEGPAEVLVDDLGCERVSSIETGGSSRAASVQAALAAVPDRRGTAVLVHDAARPGVTPAVIERVLGPLAEGFDVVVPVLSVADTIKRVHPESGEILETVDRVLLRRAQTPQACRASALHAALRDLGERELGALTDCASAIESIDGRGTTVPGDDALAKVTTPADLAALERVYGAGSAGEHADGDEDSDEDLDEHDLAGHGDFP